MHSKKKIYQKAKKKRSHTVAYRANLCPAYRIFFSKIGKVQIHVCSNTHWHWYALVTTMSHTQNLEHDLKKFTPAYLCEPLRTANKYNICQTCHERMTTYTNTHTQISKHSRAQVSSILCYNVMGPWDVNFELTVDLDLNDALSLAGLVEGGTDVDAFVVQVSLGDDEGVFLTLPSQDEGLSFYLHPILGPGEVNKRKIYRQLRARRVLMQF